MLSFMFCGYCVDVGQGQKRRERMREEVVERVCRQDGGQKRVAAMTNGWNWSMVCDKKQYCGMTDQGMWPGEQSVSRLHT